MAGPFHRRESDTQTVAIAALQEASGEIWGRTPRYGMCPTVQAYAGPIVAPQRGVEFVTEIPPHDNGSPFEARWYLGVTPGVQERNSGGEQFACIVADVVNYQPPWAERG